ncbi:hypothetical protein ACOCJ7_08935 [Knoellia sp. CPCC 206453]|uniref:hypothetical protein n=1 Tax=Knoellia pratensis TaxID=3404796 RepID=UPI003611419A
MRLTTRRLFVAAGILGMVIATAPPGQAGTGYFNTYQEEGATPNVGEHTGAQGFAVGADYNYSIKNRSRDDGSAVIYRVPNATEVPQVMTNGANNSKSIAGLGHANDMTIATIGGVNHFFIVTMSSTGYQVKKLSYSGNTYKEVGRFTVKENGATKAVSGINRVLVTSTKIDFFFKSGSTVYKGSLPATANTGTINITKAFTLKTSGALVGGKPIDLTGFVSQGFFYHESKKVLYYPLTKANVSVVLVYRNVTSTSTGVLAPSKDTSFRITSAKYSKFEIESLGINSKDGKLYFNTNRSTSTNGNLDGVQVFEGYVA